MDTTLYAWDAQDRMVGALLPDSTVIAYTYDADGRRVQADVDGTITNYLWDEYSPFGDVVMEYDASGAPLADYTLADGQLLAQDRGTPSYYLADGQGSTRALANGSGTITDTYDYTAFGELYASTGTTTNNYLYTGQQFDSNTGLYSLRARYYGPTIGRFLSMDTFPVNYGNPIELNRYGYTANNPVNRFDPSGNQGLLTRAFQDTRTIAVAGGLLYLYQLHISGQYEAIHDAINALTEPVKELDFDDIIEADSGGSGGSTSSEDPFEDTEIEWEPWNPGEDDPTECCPVNPEEVVEDAIDGFEEFIDPIVGPNPSDNPEQGPQTEPEPQPESSPQPTPQQPTPSPTPTQPKDIGLGLIAALGRFVPAVLHHFGIRLYTSSEWFHEDLTNVPYYTFDPERATLDATSNSRHIYFVLEGIDDINVALYFGRTRGFVHDNYTNAELNLIRERGFCGKTTFYSTSGTAQEPPQQASSAVRAQICSN